ncbi:MAG TPA: 3-hydroxyacyl-CoA dehydrogenase NAD-binding domain-containing protein [Candidatus Obscuribacterales bacterium]
MRQAKQIILKKKASGVAFLMIDCPGRVNLLTASVMSEMEDALEQVAGDPDVKAVCLVSGKSDTFISGADLHEIVNMRAQSEAYEMSRRGQAVLARLRRLRRPAVVGIHGSCLGGGLELALWCHRRIATDHPETVLGLPEVKLGLIPGLGGTQLLPRLVGLRTALELILSSEPVSARRAVEIGLVDDLVAPDHFMARLEKEALSLVAGGYDERAAADDLGPEKQKSLFAMMERSVRIKTKGQYPAPSRVLKVIRDGLSMPLEQALELEAAAFGELAAGEVSRNLIHLFFSSEFARQSAVSLARDDRYGRVGTVAIVGGGTMGAGIAHIAAEAGLNVVVKEADAERLAASIKSISALFQRASQRLKLGAEEIACRLGRVRPAGSCQELAGADLVIEAVFEDTDTKVAVLNEVAAAVGPDCVLATNTSSLSIARMASRLSQPERFLGIHFFHPVDKMPLVEVVTHPGTSLQTVATATALVARLGKTPVAVADGPGFLVNRLLCCYILEAGRLAEQGVPLNWIDEAAVDFGMPMGPLALLDEVGLNVAFKVAAVLHEGFGARYAPPAVLARVEALGLGGKRTGVGIYLWDDSGKRLAVNPSLIQDIGLSTSDDRPPPEISSELTERLILPMVDEAARCLEEKIVRKAREIDLAMVMGIGFPAFRGGLLRYADSLGIGRVRRRLEKVYEQAGGGRSVCDLIVRMEADGRRFYAGADRASSAPQGAGGKAHSSGLAAAEG